MASVPLCRETSVKHQRDCILNFVKIDTKNCHKVKCSKNIPKYTLSTPISTVKLGNKERFDKEQIGIKEPFSVTNLPFTS